MKTLNYDEIIAISGARNLFYNEMMFAAFLGACGQGLLSYKAPYLGIALSAMFMSGMVYEEFYPSSPDKSWIY